MCALMKSCSSEHRLLVSSFRLVSSQLVRWVPRSRRQYSVVLLLTAVPEAGELIPRYRSETVPYDDARHAPKY